MRLGQEPCKCVRGSNLQTRRQGDRDSLQGIGFIKCAGTAAAYSPDLKSHPNNKMLSIIDRPQMV